jgi:hypothetical protein
VLGDFGAAAGSHVPRHVVFEAATEVAFVFYGVLPVVVCGDGVAADLVVVVVVVVADDAAVVADANANAAGVAVAGTGRLSLRNGAAARS